MSSWLLLLGSLLLGGCWVQPEEEVDLRDPWTLDLTIAYDSSSTCSVVGATLHLVGGEPWAASGTLDGGRATCTGDRAWGSPHYVHARIWGPTVTMDLYPPTGSLRPDLSLSGDAFPERMKGPVRDLSGQGLGTWFAHQGTCTAPEIGSGNCWQ